MGIFIMSKVSVKRRTHATNRRRTGVDRCMRVILWISSRLESLSTSPFFRPLACLVLILCAAGIAIFLLSRPVAKSVTIDARCDGFELPFRTIIKLSKVQYLHFRGFRGDIENIASGSIAKQKDPIAVKSGARVSLRSADQAQSMPPSATRVVASGRTGENFLEAAAGVDLDAAQCAAMGQPCFSLDSRLAEHVKASLQSEQFDMQTTRTKIAVDGVEVAVPSSEQASLVLQNSFSFARVTFVSEAAASSGPKTAAAVVFNPGDMPNLDIRFVDAPQVPLGTGVRVRMYRCISPKITIEGSELAATKTGHLAELVLSARSLTIDKATISVADSRQSLNIALSTSANSVLVDDREVLPTQLSEILDKSLATKSLLGLVAIFLIFAGGIFAKHSLELIAKLLIPGAK